MKDVLKNRLQSSYRLHLVFIFLLVPVFAQSQDLQENDPNAEYGLVYFVRGKGNAGSATAFSALIDNVRVCKLNNRRYSVHKVEPGEHEFKAQFGGKKGKKKAEVAVIEIEPGQTYYLQMVMQASFLGQRCHRPGDNAKFSAKTPRGRQDQIGSQLWRDDFED